MPENIAASDVEQETMDPTSSPRPFVPAAAGGTRGRGWPSKKPRVTREGCLLR